MADDGNVMDVINDKLATAVRICSACGLPTDHDPWSSSCAEILQQQRDEAERRLADAVALADVASRDVLAARAERDDARAQAQTHLDGWTASVGWIDRLRALLREILDTYPEVTDQRILADVAALEGRDG